METVTITTKCKNGHAANKHGGGLTFFVPIDKRKKLNKQIADYLIKYKCENCNQHTLVCNA